MIFFFKIIYGEVDVESVAFEETSQSVRFRFHFSRIQTEPRRSPRPLTIEFSGCHN